jgi:hypothetical protein
MTKPILDSQGIMISMTAVQRSAAPAGLGAPYPRTFFKWTYTVNDGTWTGSAAAAFPFGPHGEGLALARQHGPETVP